MFWELGIYPFLAYETPPDPSYKVLIYLVPFANGYLVEILTIIKRDVGGYVRIVPTRLRFYAVTIPC